MANKELESEALRISIAGEGLGTRCWALDGLLRALQSLDVSSSDGQGVLLYCFFFSDHLFTSVVHTHPVLEPLFASPRLHSRSHPSLFVFQ